MRQFAHIDDRLVATGLPYELRLTPGTHTLRVQAHGFAPETHLVTAQDPGDEVALRVHLTPALPTVQADDIGFRLVRGPAKGERER